MKVKDNVTDKVGVTQLKKRFEKKPAYYSES
jgi:hypothetical protein